MASAQVLPNSSRKQEHLAAGKRRLEEFRKKKAAAKKATSTTQPRTADSTVYEKQASENGQAQFSNPIGAAADVRIGAAGGDSGFLNHSDKSLGFTHANGSESVALAETNVQRHNFMSPDWHQIQSKQEGDSHNSVDLKSQTSSSYQEEKEIRVRGFGGDSREGIYADGTSFGGSIPPRDDSSNYFRSTLYRAEEPLATKGNGFSEGLPNITAGISGVASEVGPEEPATNLLRNESEPGFSQRTALKLKNYLPPVSGERELSSSLGNFSSFFRQQASEPPSAGSDSVAALSGPIYSSVADTYPRRSRPSFLDSLNIGRDSPASSQPLSEKEKYKASSQFPSSHLAASSTMQEPSTACAPVEPLLTPASSSMTTDFFGSTFTGQNLFEKESERETNSRRQNEDFAALEQVSYCHCRISFWFI